ncbi:EAL domain-containing protein [Jeongeupella avenae]|uniref:EAL domain-containing protein n=2 Tax=Antarcticirhabdus aurantiaca TaxID=2606717 RepID=A0ACD4NX57_9HYPH|nr:EAL domain-containing protein [Jeongeuplla avenae]
MELKLRQALRTNDFELAFQPILDAGAMRTIGFEALLRWRDQTGTPISPAEFVPIAEDLGLMPELGEWVLRTACREAAAWDEELGIAVNVSPTQLRDRNFVEIVKRALADTRLPPHRLEIEITETAILTDVDLIRDVLEALRSLGVQVALDDFGTGFSSLALVKQLPLTRIKIDRSFVNSLDGTSRSTAVVRAVLSLCEGYGLTSTAEGVETPEQLAILIEHGCHNVQGFLTGRPMPASQASALLRGSRAEGEAPSESARGDRRRTA